MIPSPKENFQEPFTSAELPGAWPEIQLNVRAFALRIQLVLFQKPEQIQQTGTIIQQTFIMRAAFLPFVILPAAFANPADFPVVSDELEVTLFADSPLVSNPCALTFDAKGRLCVGMGPQWRAPSPETPGDAVYILTDTDGDGRANQRKQFASGFNSIQGLVWKGDDLWVANAPDLTIVRDFDGDDVADEYIRLYTDLGNLEHCLHGLNVAPDGLVYMSKGNSKGLNRAPDRIAPKPFRDLWGLTAPEGTPDFPEPRTFKPDDYQKNYHQPSDDWGRHGGILRCKADGSSLEIFSRGFRNPWDITFDDQFNWFGTDNDQTYGDKMFAPFFGSHFGWGHAWSFNWEGINHLPTVPASGPLFEGSGAGVIYLSDDTLGAENRGTFLVADWMKRELRVFRPKWNGAHLQPDRPKLEVAISAGTGRSMAKSDGRAFDPVDLEIGPDGCLYVSSWGRDYGATFNGGKQSNEGRIYRIHHKEFKPVRWQKTDRTRPLKNWTVRELIAEFDRHLPIWRSNAQSELVRRGPSIIPALEKALASNPSTGSRTWLLWTIAQLDDWKFAGLARSNDFEIALQAIRILAHRSQLTEKPIPASFDWPKHTRLRFALATAVREAGSPAWKDKLISLASTETDRLTFYSCWGAMAEHLSSEELRTFLQHESSGVKKAALLALLETDQAKPDDVKPLTGNPDAALAGLATSWLHAKGIGIEPLITATPPAGDFSGALAIQLTSKQPRTIIRYTTDGSTPGGTSPVARGLIPISKSSTIRALLIQDHLQKGPVHEFTYREVKSPPNAFVGTFSTPRSKRTYDLGILRNGFPIYTDRGYVYQNIPSELDGLTAVRTPNNDCDSRGDDWLHLHLTYPSTIYVGHDHRSPHVPSWLEEKGFRKTDLVVPTTDGMGMTMIIYKKDVMAGPEILGGNTNDGDGSHRGNYMVAIRPKVIAPPTQPTTLAAAKALLPHANLTRGRDLFLSKQGVQCTLCHQMEGLGNIFAPDLSDLGKRAEADFIIQSIIDPSATITEGFATQIITTTDGQTRAGIVVEETGQSITLAFANGTTKSIPTSKIKSRKGSHISPMPPFAGALAPQQVADLAAYLLSKKPGFSFNQENPNELKLALDGSEIATYLLKHDKLTRRAFVNVKTPSGIQVTRNFPPRKPDDIDPGYGAEQGIIHPVMHPGIWMSFGWIDGNDYWRLQSKVKFEGYLKEPTATENAASFTTRDQYLDKSGQNTICFQDTSYRFTRTPMGVRLDWHAVFYNRERDFTFGDQEESGLALRIASPLRVQGGNGRILNNHGQKNGKGTWGKEFTWIDYSGVSNGKRAGVLIVPDPKNARPCWSHSRDYGALVSNPFPKQPKERREPYVTTTVKRGQLYQLKYTVLIHESENAEFDPAAAVKALQRK